ncbi:MAG: TM0996/MTH895 family glutaredoxin-like protein [Phycisphaerae bacterium]|nr:TM0996/MTH895 family glutaredoxin-like protein [Phycisphaerae bacterium]
MKLEVLGTGCAKCNALEDAVRKAADELGIDYTLDHVKDLGKIASYGVMMTPALVIDGQVKIAGKLPSAAELKKLLQA